jgi:hypothetical protein
MGAILAFCIGNAVQNDAQRFRWCPVSGEYGQTRCGITAVAAAHTWAGMSRRKMNMGTQRADRRTWIMRDPKEGTIGRILSLLSGRNGDKTSLMARLKTTPWSRKKQAMVKKEQLQEPPCAPEEESAPARKPRAAYGGEEHTAASRRSIDETWPSCVGWTSRSWEMSLVRGMTNENLSSSPFRQMMANG